MLIKTYKDRSFDESYSVIDHPCGLRIMFCQKPFRTFTASLRVRFGEMCTAYRLKGQKRVYRIPRGTAHFLEHKMFEDEDGQDILTEFFKFGADANAYTSWDQTTYCFTGTSHFKENLSILLSMVKKTHFTDESVEKEKGIIGEELCSYLDDPVNSMYVAAKGNLYSKLAYRYDLGGSVATIRNIDKDILTRIHRTFYRPDNMVLSVCGNPDQVDIDTVYRAVTEQFGDAKREDPLPEPVYPDEPDSIVRAQSTLTRTVAGKGFCLSFKGPARKDRTDLELYRQGRVLSIVNELLFSGSSRLKEELQDRGLLLGDLTSSVVVGRNLSCIQISGWSERPEQTVSFILSYIEKYKKTGFSKPDVERAVKVALSESLLAFDSVDAVAEMMGQLAFYKKDCYSLIRTYRKVTADDCRTALKRYFRTDFMTYVRLLPLRNAGRIST
ncbi:MAG: insulinase family protein [Clostridia bacterium]|nr:insulinase family protein [Clostridia bacterium]